MSDIIRADCKRSYSFFQKSVKLGNKESLDNKRNELELVLHIYFSTHKDRGYYQGLNVVCELFCMTYGKILGYILTSRFIDYHFHIFMQSEGVFEKNIKKSLELSLYILKHEVPMIIEILQIDNDDNTVALGFLISMILTWTGSRISNEEKVFRVYDYLLCCDDPITRISYILSSICIEIVSINNIDTSTPVHIYNDRYMMYKIYYTTLIYLILISIRYYVRRTDCRLIICIT